MKKKKMTTWVCECDSVGLKHNCKVTSTHRLSCPIYCPFNMDRSKPNWKRERRKKQKR